MSLIENLAPRGRGRPPKPKEPEPTPLEAVLAKGLPAEIHAPLAEYQAAVAAFKIAAQAYRDAKDAAQQTPEKRLKEAQNAVESTRHAILYRQDDLRDANRDVREAAAKLEEANGAFFGKDVHVAEAAKVLAEAERRKESAEAHLAAVNQRHEDAKAELERARVDPEAAAYDALMKAHAKRDVARQIGGVLDVPTDAEIEQLEQAYDKLKNSGEASRGPRLAVLAEEVDRRRELVSQTDRKLREALAPFESALTAAADEQIAAAATLIAQAEQLKSYRKGFGQVDRPFEFKRIDGGGTVKGDPTLPQTDVLLSLYGAIWRGQHEASRSI